jgi:hypothetical protein
MTPNGVADFFNIKEGRFDGSTTSPRLGRRKRVPVPPDAAGFPQSRTPDPHILLTQIPVPFGRSLDGCRKEYLLQRCFPDVRKQLVSSVPLIQREVWKVCHRAATKNDPDRTSKNSNKRRFIDRFGSSKQIVCNQASYIASWSLKTMLGQKGGCTSFEGRFCTLRIIRDMNKISINHLPADTKSKPGFYACLRRRDRLQYGESSTGRLFCDGPHSRRRPTIPPDWRRWIRGEEVIGNIKYVFARTHSDDF